ncbi:MAG: hypothetical protein M1308_20590 [Actinobacteria bacterium]|nr:hypothetical protein [Actinomycetota bacterium]
MENSDYVKISQKEVIAMPKDDGFVSFVQIEKNQTENLTAVQNCDCYDCDYNCEECDSK